MGRSKQLVNKRRDNVTTYKTSQGQQSTKPTRQKPHPKKNEAEETPRTAAPISPSLPIPLQQLILNVFKTALLPPKSIDPNSSTGTEPETEAAAGPLSLAEQIQTIKAHLYRRDFARAFAEADEHALRAYAVRWSAGRALGYAGVFWGLREMIFGSGNDRGGGGGADMDVLCVGGGAGAEIMALAGVWRAMRDGWENITETERKSDNSGRNCSRVRVMAVDIADWSGVVERLEKGIRSEEVPSDKPWLAPLLPCTDDTKDGDGSFTVQFRKEDVLSLSEEDIRDHLRPSSTGATTLVTLLFTLNELFSTSMPKTVTFLLRLTDLLTSGAILLIVDSPGSYSTLSLGAKTATTTATTEQQEESQRKYPMRFLLEHTLLSVATGKWERVLSDESRWFRRDRNALSYDVGEGIGLEDMRYQIHVYRRL